MKIEIALDENIKLGFGFDTKENCCMIPLTDV